MVAAPRAASVGVALLAWGVVVAVLTFARWPALSWSVGATCLGTVYQSVNAVPTVLFAVAAGTALAAVGVPMMVGALGHSRPRDVPKLGSAVLTWAIVVLGILSAVAWVAADPLAEALVGDSGCTGAVAVATTMLRWFAPQPLLLGAGAVLDGILRAHGRPMAAALGPALASVVLVGSLVWFRQLAVASDTDGVPDLHLAVLAGGSTLAALVLALVPAVVAWRSGLGLRPTLRMPAALADDTRGVVLACGLGVVGQLFAAVAAVVVTARSGVGVLPVHGYVQGTVLAAYAAVLLPLVGRALARLAGAPVVAPEPVEELVDPEATVVFTRSARHRRKRSVGALAGRARGAVAAGLVGAASLAAAALPVGGMFRGVDAARETTQGALALDAVTPGVWATAAAPALFGLSAVLCAALYVRGRPFVAGGAVAAAWLIGGGIPLVAVMPGASPTWAVVVLGLAMVLGLLVATLDLLAATSRAWGPGALAGLGRTVVVGVVGALLGAAVGVAGGRWWSVEGAWANAGVAVVLAATGGLVTAGVVALADRELAGWFLGRLRPAADVPEGLATPSEIA
jgi:putative peptidoglycan lipid II flippase